MQRINTPNKVVDLFGAGKHGFRNSNKAAGIPATELDAGLFNSWQEEIANVIEHMGLVLNPNDNTQLLTAMLGMIDAALGVPVGTVIIWSGTTPPANYMVLPTAATTLSRATFSELHTLVQSWGYPWGAGDGVTTFGSPWLAPDNVPLQANGNVGTVTTGEVKAHTHSYERPGGSTGALSGGANSGPTTSVTGSTGGSANIAAGARYLHCLKYRRQA